MLRWAGPFKPIMGQDGLAHLKPTAWPDTAHVKLARGPGRAKLFLIWAGLARPGPAHGLCGPKENGPARSCITTYL